MAACTIITHHGGGGGSDGPCASVSIYTHNPVNELTLTLLETQTFEYIKWCMAMGLFRYAKYSLPTMSKNTV